MAQAVTSPADTPINPGITGGRLPVSAEKIESCLNQIWQSHISEPGDENPPTHLCLANILIVSDSSSRLEAERLAHHMATIQPSRVLSIVIDDNINDYFAHVSTACNFSRNSDSVVCWEIIEIESDNEHAEQIPGAIRSLLVDSVPVITIDFRSLQTLPLFDATVLNLSDFYFVNAEIVPVGRLNKNFLPLRWYRSLPLRELLSDFFSAMQSEHCRRYPEEFMFYIGNLPDRLDILVGGWVIHRLGDLTSIVKREDGVEVKREIRNIRLRWQKDSKSGSPAATIKFDDGSTADITTESNSEQEPIYTITYNSLSLTRRQEDNPLARYIIEATRDSAEFREYRAMREVVKQTAIG